MNWLMEYQADIAALEQARADAFPVNFADDEQLKLLFEEFKEVFAALRAGDTEGAIEIWWQKFKASQIAALKREVAILHRLAPLFEKLGHASDAEWEEFAHIQLRARLHSQQIQLLLRMLVANSEATKGSPEPHEGG